MLKKKLNPFGTKMRIIKESDPLTPGNLIFDNGELYFEPGDHKEWEYPDDTTIQEITWWYRIIAVMSGFEIKIDLNSLKLI